MADDYRIVGTVDVVIPMRNGAATIRQAVASANAQTVPPRSIIVVDDGSTDGGPDLVRDLPLVEVIATPPTGVSHARNAGVRAARAEFVAFLDCDDLWRPDKLERQLAIAHRHPEAALITCDHMGMTPAGTLIPAIAVRPRYEGRVLRPLLRDLFVAGGWSSSMMARRAAFLRVGGYDEGLRFFEDADLSARIAAHYPIAACPETLTYVVENPSSTMRRPEAAAPEFLLEVILQGLVVADRWIGESGAPALLAQEAARLILSKFVRNRLPASYLPRLQVQMAQRTPVLASRIARSVPHLLFHLALAGVRGMGRMTGMVRRQLARRAALTRPAPQLASLAKSTA